MRGIWREVGGIKRKSWGEEMGEVGGMRNERGRGRWDNEEKKKEG